MALVPLCRVSRAALLLPAVLAAAPLAAQTTFSTPEQTLAEFRSYCERVVASHDPYFGRAQVAEGFRRLEQYLVPDSEVRVRLQLAYELTRLGELEQAITQARAALDLLRKTGQDASPALLGAWKVLGVANYQLGEDANCITLHPEGACILPIRPGAVHARPENARAAAEAFLEILRLRPDEVNARWLLNLSRMVSGDYPEGVPEPLRLPPGAFATPADATPFPLWIDIAPHLGVAALDLAGGAVMDDFDGDGRLDLISSTWDPCDSLKAFRNNGDGTFTDVTEAWGLHAQLGGLNLVHADYDHDGDLDLLVLRGAWQGPAGRVRRSLLRNDLDSERGRFVDVTAAAGIAYPAYPSQAAAWADYDNDGDLDLYIGTEADQLVVDPSEVSDGLATGHPAHLFRNNGDGTFTDVAATAGVQDRGFTKGVAWGDFDGDGLEDLFLSNFGPDRLFRNRGDGTFEDVTLQTGVAGGSRRNFATWFFDYDNDGDLDLYVSSFHGPAATVAAWHFGLELRSPAAPGRPSEVIRSNPFLYRNDGGRFTEVSDATGLGAPHLVMGSNFGDLDADGWLDLYLGTGQPDFSALHPNAFYRNRHGERFEDLTFRSGLGHLQKGHGVAFGDLDGDGDEDLFQQLGGAFPYDKFGNALYLNPSRGSAVSSDEPRWLVLRLRGVRANRFGVGARVRIDVVDAGGARRSIHRRVDTGGSFGGSSHQLEVALGDARTVERIEIRWPGSGTVDRFAGAAFDHYYEAVEGAAMLRALDVTPIQLRVRPVTPHH